VNAPGNPEKDATAYVALAILRIEGRKPNASGWISPATSLSLLLTRPHLLDVWFLSS